MAETQSMRIVPSGKIYRQMFEAQVQLNRSLTKIPRDGPLDKIVRRSSTTVPVVHMAKEDVDHGILGERQKTWADGFPNDPYVENPVVYKQYAEYVKTQMQESDSFVAGREVQGLPDLVEPAKQGSNIIERIAASRKDRHEATVEEMHQELSVINSEMEPHIAEVCESLLKKLEEDDEIIARKLARIETDEDLLTYNLEQLEKLWLDVECHSPERQTWIQELDTSLSQAEDDRMELIRTVFKDYAKTLEKIAHVLSPDLHRLMDKESQLINQTVLSNRRSYGDLFVRLMSTDIEREKAQHIQWKRRVDDWKMLNTELAISKFRKYMAGSNILQPQGVTKVLQFMVKDQQLLNDKRLDLVAQLRELKPPSSTKTSVYNWNKGIQDISQEIDASNQEHLTSLHREYEAVCQYCLDEVECVKTKMVDSGICNKFKAQAVVDEFMIPLVGKQQRVYEQTLEGMEKDLERQHSSTLEQLRVLFKFAQSAAHIWDVHEIGLARQERALQEKLEQCRQKHDTQNQDKEAHLDVVMDRMRQDASEKALKDSLTKCLDMLDKIRAAYEVFHNDQTEIVKEYPGMVKQELKNYDDAVCRLFTVDRSKPNDTESPQGEGSDPGADVDEDVDKGTPDISSPSVSDNDDETSGDDDDDISDNDNVDEYGMAPPKKKTFRMMNTAKDLPSAVSEVLNTQKGTTFYVLSVAGIPPEKSQPSKQSTKDAKSSFMTEVEGSEERSVGDPEYIQSIEVSEDILSEIKRIIRMNFLNHLEEWTEQALERSAGVVVAKCEEMNSELDLRLHLHKPRARRAEYDVHNVRAAELVMHSERVTRHCKGILQALTDVRSRFTEMTTEHNKLAVKFRQGIEALEVVFTNATKASKLYGLKNQLNLELEKFMTVIRASLRQFRQHLDETLQMLRESNARFIKSFKVFSDGGNFCPEEIEEYRKRLEKMSQKIDTSEGSIMSDLEGMESKRLEQATKVAMEFEDRFKSHMFDLIFMEKIARWLTNTQVKIKAEVAKSNSQAQMLGKHLADLDRRIDACERPNLDKEQITSRELNETLAAIFEAFKNRSVYLNCLKDPAPRPGSEAQLGQGPGARVGFVSDTAPTPISKAGKQPTEDPSVHVIKNIMKVQKSKMRFGIDAELDGEYAPMYDKSIDNIDLGRCGSGKLREVSLMIKEINRSKHLSAPSDARDKMRSSMSNNTSSERGKLRTGPSPGLSLEAPRKTLSAMTSVSSRGEWMRRTNKPVKYEKRILIFGDNIQEDDETADQHFLGIGRKTLKEALDGLLATAELYYRQKGSRPVTRPQALQENFDQCADVIVQKLQSYYQQSDEYHNQCLQEFRNQLTTLERSVSHIPALIIGDLLKDQIDQSQQAQQTFEGQFSQQLSDLQQKKDEHKQILRPTLGHPHQQGELTALCDREMDRHQQYQGKVEEHTHNLQESTLEYAKMFVEMLTILSEKQLKKYDKMLVVDDVNKGRVEPSKYPTSELIRRRNAGEPLEDDEDKNALPRGKNTWPGFPSNDLNLETSRNSVKQTPSVTSTKTTLGHSSTITARDQAYQDYKKQFEENLRLIEEEKQRQLLAETRWMDSWNTSVEKVKMLY